MGQRRRHLKMGGGLIIGGGLLGMLFGGREAQAGEIDKATESVSLLTVALEKGKMAWQYFKDNMASVSMIALTVATMLFDPLVLLGLLSKAALLAGAAFVGWKIGEWLNQFAFVREGARIVVTAILDFGFATAAAISGWWTNSVQPALANLAGFIGFAWDEVSLAFANLGFLGTLDAFGSLIESSLNNLWAGLGTVIMAPVRLLSDVIGIVGRMVGEVVAAVVSGNWGDAGMAIIKAIGTGVIAVGAFLTNTISGVFQMVLETILAIFPTMRQYGGDLLLNLAKGITTSTGKVLKAIQELWDVLKKKFNAMIESIGNTLKNGIQQKFSSLKNSVSNAFKSITNLFPHSDAKEGPFKHLTASGRAIMTTMSQGIKQGEGSFGKALSQSFMNSQKMINSKPLTAPAIVAEQKANLTNLVGGLNASFLKLEKSIFKNKPKNELVADMPLSIPQLVDATLESPNALLETSEKTKANQQKTSNVSFGNIVINMPATTNDQSFDAQEMAQIVREQFEMSLNEQLRRSMFDYEE